MDNFLYAMNTSFESMKEKVQIILQTNVYTNNEENELFLVIGTCLHCIVDYAERVDKSIELKTKDIKLLSAFRYVNNSLKHSIEVKEITKQSGGFLFPISFPLEIPERKVVWKIVDNGDKENQMKNYKTCLEGKDVIDTCEDFISELKKYNLKF